MTIFKVFRKFSKFCEEHDIIEYFSDSELMPAKSKKSQREEERCWSCQCGIGIFVRLFHTGLCIAITGTLLWKDSGTVTINPIPHNATF